MWEGNKSQAAALESVLLGGGKWVFGCSSKTCNEAVWGDLGIDTLQGRRDKAKLKWWYNWLLCLRIGTQRSCLVEHQAT